MRSAVSSDAGRRRHPGHVVARARRGRRRRRGTRRRRRRRRTRRRSPRRRRPGRRRPRRRATRTSRRCAGRPGRWPTDVTSTPPIRSSATAMRTSAATASGSRPPARRRWRVSSDSGWNANISASRPAVPPSSPRAEPDVEVPAATRRAARGSRSGGGSRGSPSARRRRRRRPPPTVSRLVASHAARDGGVVGVDLAGDGRRARRRPSPASRRRGDADVAGHGRAHLGPAGRGSTTAPGRADLGGLDPSSTSHARSRPSRVPATTLSVRLFEASRLAPCTPVHDTSPTAYKPGDRRRAVEAGRHATAGVVRGRGDGDALAGRVDADGPAGLGDRREAGRRSARPCGWRRGTRGRRCRRAPRPCAG